MTTIPTTADAIKEAARQTLQGYIDAGDPALPGEWEALESGEPVVKVDVSNDGSTGRYLTLVVWAALETSDGLMEAGKSMIIRAKRPDGRLSREECGKRILIRRGLHKVTTVPIRYESHGL